MRLTVVSVAYPLTTVGQNAVGGSEQILTTLDRALTEAGHRSLVIAAEGSVVSGRLIPSPAAPEGALTDAVRKRGQRAHRRILRQTLAKYSVDLVHMHSLDFHRYLPEGDTPTLATLHLPPDWYPRKIFRSKRENFYLNCVSATQRRGCLPSPFLSTVPNGVDVDKFAIRVRKGNHAVALGRICPEKGYHVALKAAKKAGVDLLLAGEVFPYEHHLNYFRRQIKPLLDAHRRFIGPVGLERKVRLLSEARCLLVPSSVAETSSLVAMEALAAGTPVIAFPSGALPEIVEHGKTGYIVTNAREMADAIDAVDHIDPEKCRSTARRRFSDSVMVEGYMHLYRNILAKQAVEREHDFVVAERGSWLMTW